MWATPSRVAPQTSSGNDRPLASGRSLDLPPDHLVQYTTSGVKRDGCDGSPPAPSTPSVNLDAWFEFVCMSVPTYTGHLWTLIYLHTWGDVSR